MELLLFIRSITQCFRMYRTIFPIEGRKSSKHCREKNQTTPFHLSACQISRLILEVVFDRSQVNQQQAFFFGRRCLFCRNCSGCQLTVKRRERWKSLWHRHVVCECVYNFPWERLSSSLLTKNSTKRNEDLFKNKMERPCQAFFSL